jgi:hypothetical protein
VLTQWAARIQEAKQNKYKVKKEEQLAKIQASLQKIEVRIEQCRKQMELPMEGQVSAQGKEQLRSLQVQSPTLTVYTGLFCPYQLQSLVCGDAWPCVCRSLFLCGMTSRIECRIAGQWQ